MTTQGRFIQPLHGLAAVLAVTLAGTIGSLATLPSIPGWYAGLTKPWFTPPNGVFGPAWTFLYVLMAIAFYRVLQSTRTGARTVAIVVFLLHMAFNALWSIAFFGQRSPALGLVDLAFLWPAALANVVLFWRVDRIAGALMVPNLLWVTFAAMLNFAVWRLN